MHALPSDLFFAIEFYAFHIAALIIVLVWLYRHVKREIQRDD